MPEQAVRPSDRAGRRARAGGAVLWALVGLLTVAGPAPAAAADAPYGAASTRCEITDPRLLELSGLATAGDTMLAINDGGDRVEVYVLDGSCRVTEVRSAPVDPHDPEDLAMAADGTLWLADTGDNVGTRDTVALIGLRPDGSSTLTRLTYPDGPHDAEALLLAPDGTPYLVTKEVLGESSVYRPDAPLDDGATVPMSRVLGLGFTLTGTPGGPVGRAGQLMVTGGAVSADGQRIALRTYTDAYVWPLTGSDVVGALSGEPVRVPLPDAPQGEAIAFAANNRDLLVSGEGLPATVTRVPAGGALSAAGATAATASTASTAATATTTATAAAGTPEEGAAPAAATQAVSPLTAGLVAAAIVTVLVWLGRKLRRRGSQ